VTVGTQSGSELITSLPLDLCYLIGTKSSSRGGEQYGLQNSL
jgi:hypothetical protein